MTKSFPGGLMRDFDPALSDRGGAYVGMADVGVCILDVTANVNTAGNHALVHSLKATPSHWLAYPMNGSARNVFFEIGVTAANQSAIYYTANFTSVTGAQAAVATRFIIYR